MAGKNKRRIDCIAEEMLRWFGEKVASQRQHTIVLYDGQKKTHRESKADEVEGKRKKERK